MADQYSRTRLLLGNGGIEQLKNARIALFGLGGVGGYAAEALARAGIGHMDLIDDDTISLTNLNRQILATHSSIGMYKVDVAAARIHDIDPSIKVRTFRTFYLPETADQFDFSQYDYVLDAIDTVTGKLALIAQAKAEERRAMAVALEQENKAKAQDARAKVILAEAEVPLAMAEAFRNGNLGIMDYYKMKNIIADTQMRDTLSKSEKK